MFIGFAIFIILLGLAFWVLIFALGFCGIWAHWGAMEMIKAKLAQRGFDEEV